MPREVCERRLLQHRVQRVFGRRAWGVNIRFRVCFCSKQAGRCHLFRVLIIPNVAQGDPCIHEEPFVEIRPGASIARILESSKPLTNSLNSLHFAFSQSAGPTAQQLSPSQSLQRQATKRKEQLFGEVLGIAKKRLAGLHQSSHLNAIT